MYSTDLHRGVLFTFDASRGRREEYDFTISLLARSET